MRRLKQLANEHTTRRVEQLAISVTLKVALHDLTQLLLESLAVGNDNHTPEAIASRVDD